MPPKTVQMILGHSDIRLTLNTYAHILPAVQRDAADLMEAILPSDHPYKNSLP